MSALVHAAILFASFRLSHCQNTFEFSQSNFVSASDGSLTINSTVLLNDGTSIPLFGFGVYPLRVGEETENAVRWALQYGYRHVDTASNYGNEESVGRVVMNSGIPREEIFITTKIWNDDHGYEKTLEAGRASLARLGTGYIDLLLMHAPGEQTVTTWQAMIQLKEEGVCRSVGVSNFGVHHLEELHKTTGVTPSVNQIELSPYLQRRDIVDYCQAHGIALEGYSPLTRGLKLKDPILVKIAAKYPGKTTAHVLLRWSVQQRYITIPKSGKEERIKANIDVFDFNLDEEDMAELETLEEYFLTDWDPTVDEWKP
ncbi:9,11-endoperoxide prostaglandin H2 reductase-like [Corticium candelabrum]|uniref:9,11-endoperoxide prostaglandin H2 reductase-like n=1 Tax=Corticium candelabrum TaxID=121492 RepID=UPI002E25BD22|nr:9,11-endoperoxide prostaglandin H2 reductase-like [Corticium candelabrum]